MDKETARQGIGKLVERFLAQQPYYESSSYLERQLQTDFIDKLFEELGWDIANRKGLSPFDREVLVEKGDTKGRPDYSFRINGEDAFFVEAKSPSKGTDNHESIFQAKRYGYSTRKVGIVVLTDFKTFKVFDTTLKPDVKQPRVGLIFELELTKLSPKDFDQLWLFSHEQVVAGSLAQLSSKEPGAKRLRIPVDVAFLEQMTEWREILAKDVHKLNLELSVRELNDIVQRILDRLVFIRILEDRKIIESKTLKEISENWKESKHRDIQPQLNDLFKRLNEDFNGEIFKPHPCGKKALDSKTISEIIDGLYYPSPYDFSAIGVEILGIIYEKYLGKTIRLTEKRIKVEEKPEVRKAGGVYYTPKWVVEYIVENTAGKLIDKKKPDEIAKLHILDPACGSGSFLIGALEKLFRYHVDYYLNNPKEAKQGTLFPHLILEKDEFENETPRLSIEKKGEILKNNIYGVDIDPQAVEITMMSLYIKVLEGERTLPHNKELLPSLANNIRCGNSLIGFDFLAQKTLTEEAEKEKANPFEWRSKTTGFGNIIGDKGGFDVIIGNPPYIRIQTMKEWAPKEVEYFSEKYQAAASGNYDIYVVFVERAIELLSDTGSFGFIMPHKFFQAEYGQNLRKLIAEKKLLREIVSFTDQQVFDQATTYTCFLFLSKTGKNRFKYAEVRKLENPKMQTQTIQINSEYSNGSLRISSLPLTGLSEQPWQFSFGKEMQLLEKLKRVKTTLGGVSSTIFVGLQTSADPVYIVERKNPTSESKLIEVYSKALEKNLRLEAEILKPLLKGEEIKRYATPYWRYWLIFPYRIVNGKSEVISKEDMEKKYPHAWSYLNNNRKKLQSRDKGDKMGDHWYAYVYPKNLSEFSQQKIMTGVLANKASFTIDKDGHYYFVGGGGSGGYGIRSKPEYKLNSLYLLGLLNSKILDWYLKKVSTVYRGGYYVYAKRFIEQLPIYVPNDKEVNKKAGCEEIAHLADKILELNKKKQNTPDASMKDRLEREIKVYEEKIDEIAYRLYDIAEEEKSIIEDSLK